MSDISVEKKLELVQQIRSRHYQNQSDLMNREQILYGRPLTQRPANLNSNSYIHQTESGENPEEGIFKDNTIKIRYALAAVLLVTIILFDKTGNTIAGISMEQVFSYISTDYEAVIDAWASSALQEEGSITP